MLCPFSGTLSLLQVLGQGIGGQDRMNGTDCCSPSPTSGLALKP